MDPITEQLLHGVTVRVASGETFRCKPLTVRQIIQFEEWSQAYAEAIKKNGDGKMHDAAAAARILMTMAKAFPAAVGCEALADHLNPADIPDLLLPFYLCPTGAEIVRAETNGSAGMPSSPLSSPSPDAPPILTS